MSTAVAFVRSPHMKMYDGQPLEPGQVFQMRSQPNDEKLIRLEYVGVLKKADAKAFAKCIRCGATFADEGYCQRHMRKCPQQTIDLDGPNLKGPRRTPGVEIDPDGAGDLDLEPEGSPAPPPIGAGGIAAGSGLVPASAVERGSGSAGRKSNEVIRLG